MDGTRVLVVDDDPKIRTLLQNCLESEGFEVLQADSARQVLDTVAHEPLRLITLDIHLGEDDGFDIARSIRKHSQVPIIMVTGKDDVIDRVVGLEVGADDYITKPFHVREVLARVRAVLRRSDARPQPVQDKDTYALDGLRIIPAQFEVWSRDGTEAELTTGDFKLLNVFLSHPKRVLSREQLMDLVGGLEWSPLDRTIDNQVARLRKKIERDPANPRLIKTVRGVGYTLVGDVTKLRAQELVKTD